MLKAGSTAFVDGVPVQLLYLLIRKDENIDVWMVKPLFVDEPDYPEELNRNVTYRQLHAKPPGWNFSLGARPRSIYGGRI